MYYQYDGANSVTELTNRHGEVIENYRYDAFGNIFTGITSPYNITGYTGQDYDDLAGLVQMDARWYDPNIGRFTTQDTYFGDIYTSQSLNRYSYVMNNPVNMWDPTGHVPEWVGDQYHIVRSEDERSMDLYELISYNTSISDYYLINTRTTDTNIIYQYEATITNTWYYDYYYLLQNTNDSTIYHVVSGPTSMTYSRTSGYPKEVTVTAAEIAGANAEYIKNLAGDPPKDTDPPAVSISTMQVGKDPVQMLDFEVNGTRIDIVGTLSDFQKSYGMATSGVVDDETIHQLMSIYKHNNQYTEEVVTEVITSTEVGFQTYAGGYSQDVYSEGAGKTDAIELFSIEPKDVTRTIAEYLIANPVAVYATQHGWFKDLFYAAGFVRDDKGVYHARQDALQQYGGYNFLYDIVFDYASSMKTQPFEFTYDGQDYRFWAWKGDYLNLGAGAELGLYKRLSVLGNQTDHWLVDTSLALPMTLTLEDDKGNPIASYNPSEPQWWITAFNPYKQNVNAGDLRVTYTVDFRGTKRTKECSMHFINSMLDRKTPHGHSIRNIIRRR